MSLLGYSQPTVVQYLIGLSKQAASPADLAGKLVEFGISLTDTRAFAEEIFSRVPRKLAGLNQYQKQEREAAMLARKQKTYTILKADDSSDDDCVDKYSITTTSSRKPDNQKKHFRKKTEVQDDQDDEVILRKERDRQVKRRTSPDEDTDSESEEERLKDQREKEELEQHMRERDAAGTRKLAEAKLTQK